MNEQTQPSKKKQKHYKQVYSKRWEKVQAFKGWLTESKKSKFHSHCICCNSDFTASKFDCARHAKSTKHIKKYESFKSQNISWHISDSENALNNTEDEMDPKDYEEEEIDSTAKDLGMGGKIIRKRIATADGSYLFVESASDIFKQKAPKKTKQRQSVTDYVKNISNEVVDVIRMDLENLLNKNKALVNSIKSNPGFSTGENGVCRLARMLVGHLAQHYLTDFSVESWKSGIMGSSKNLVATKLNYLEQAMEKSMVEMRNIKTQLETGEDFDATGNTLEALSANAC